MGASIKTGDLMKHALFLATAALVPSGCSTVDEVIAYGKGPFDHGPIPRNETALEGLHESSWGNSGRWGKREEDGDTKAPMADEAPAEDSATKPPE